MGCEKYKPTYILIALNVAIYIYGAIVGGNAFTTGDSVVYQWGQVNLFVFQGAYWQLFTSMFIHASIFHLVGNMLFLAHFRFARRRNVFASRIPRNLPCRRLSRQRSFFSVWTTLYFCWSFRRNFRIVWRMRNL